MSERDYQALQASGDRAGLEKLKKNGWKGGWFGLKYWVLHKALNQERREESVEYVRCERSSFTDKKQLAAWRLELADERNFIDMLIQKIDMDLDNVK